MLQDWVFVDTCIWASFFDKPSSPEKAAVDDLIDNDRVALEVFMGFRRKDQADWVASRLKLANYVEADWDHWRTAADLGRDLAAKGHKIPLTDLVLASVVKRGNASVYTTDPDFDLISDSERYWPGK